MVGAVGAEPAVLGSPALPLVSSDDEDQEPAEASRLVASLALADGQPEPH